MNTRTLKIMHKIALSLLLLMVSLSASAQDTDKLIKDTSFMMEIPEVTQMDASPAHMYIMSQKEGLVVYRTNPDTLQWLYSSEGMQKRGSELRSDIRFAYIFGNQKRLTVLEPTSLLGVYSSTALPTPAHDVQRIGNNLYIALDTLGMGMVSLQTPSTVDSTIMYPRSQELSGQRIIDLESADKQLFALSDQSVLFPFNQDDGQLTGGNAVTLKKPVQSIFAIGDQLLGSSDSGTIFRITSGGNTEKLFEIDGPVANITPWQGLWIIRTKQNKIWIAGEDKKPYLWKDDTKAGNYFAVSKHLFFLNEYERISRVIKTSTNADTANANNQQLTIPELELKSITNRTLPYPNPLIVALETENDIPAGQIQFSVRSHIENINIRNQGLYWQPKNTDVGEHTVTVVATTNDNQADSTKFTVDIRPFNTPPRFTPVRDMKIGVNQNFRLPIKAFDPDGIKRDLIRYIGVDMPQGASIDEQTGIFSWEPSLKQTGEHTFQIVATDQYGAASSKDISLTVIEQEQQ